MPSVKSTIQLLVQPSDKKYRIKPLFYGHPEVVAERFDEGLRMIKKRIKESLKHFKFNRDSGDPLLWMIFNPDLKSKLLPLRIPVGRAGLEGNFYYSSYQLQGMTFICLPAFNHYQFIASYNIPIEDQVADTIAYLVKTHKKSLDSREVFDLSIFTTPKGTFVHPLDMNLSIVPEKFSFEEQDLSSLFASIVPSSKFNGQTEIYAVGENLNERYPGDLSRAYQRDQIIDQLVHQIFRGNRTPIVIVGKRGVGKNTLINEVLYRYLEREIDPKDFSQTIWQINPNRIITGMSIVGWWQKRFEAIIDYARLRLKKINGKLTTTDHLLFDNPIAMLRIGQSSQNKFTLNNVLLPYLEKRMIGVIILATPEEWQIVQEKNQRFANLFQVTRLPEFDYKTAVKAVIEQRCDLEDKNHCQFTIQAIDQLFTLQRNFMQQKALPGSVMRIMNQLAARYRHQFIDLPEVRENFEQFSGLNQKIFDESLTLESDEIEKFIGQDLVGQPTAVKALADTIHQIKSRLNNPRRPLSSFMFIGPTGVGKTQAAKVLAKYLTGNEERLVRFDMNEFVAGDAVDRLIGTYYQPEGQLTGKVRHTPFGILLLDEIEKAHPSVHDLLLQVLDDGRLTDSLGKTVDFTNMIIIMTSNVGAREISSQLGFEKTSATNQAIYQTSLRKKFRPEFINRIDQVVIFKSLSFEHILNIARLQIKELLSRDGFVRRTTILDISQEALTWVAKRGFDEKMGGRALKRQIERDLTMLSAEQLIATQEDLPILFRIDIDEAGNQLVPNIQQLRFASMSSKNNLPDLPTAASGKRFFRKQLEQLERIEKKIYQLEESAPENDEPIMITGAETEENLNWQYYNFKNNLIALKEELTSLSLGYGSGHYIQNQRQAFRFKAAILSKTDETISLEDQLFDQESLAEITENYRYGTIKFDSTATDFLSAWLQVSWIKKSINPFLKGDAETVILHFKSCINQMGKTEIDFLLKRYKSLFDHLDLTSEINKKQGTISVSGYGLSELLTKEVGYTLFYQSHRNPIPILTNLTNQKGQSIANQDQLRVLRVFDIERTMTDLRTGLTSLAKLTAEEFLLLVMGS